MADSDTYYDRLLRRLKNNKVVAVTLVLIAVLGGGVAALTTFEELLSILWREDPEAAEIVLSQFTVDTEDSHFVGRVVDGSKPLSVVNCCDEGLVDLAEVGIHQGSVLEVVQTEKGKVIAGIFARLARGWATESDEAWLSRVDASGDPSGQVRSAGDPATSGIFTGIFPIFGVSFLNRSSSPAILSALQIEGFMFLEGGDAYAEEVPIRPLSVSHRYVLDLNEYKTEAEGVSARKAWLSDRIESPAISLTPPIKMGAHDALRIQVQLIDTGLDINAQQYLLRLTFLFSNGNSVSTDFFSFSHYH